MLLIDGHNLIPKIPGWSLGNIDDEQQLIEALQSYVAAHPRVVEVFFDKAPVGFSGQRRYGRILAHFVVQGQTADNAIRMRLDQLGREAKNATVVSSDRQVQGEARSHGAQVVSSDVFAQELQKTHRPVGHVQETNRKKGKGSRKEVEITPDELDEWLKMFGADEYPDQKKKGKTS
jgi:uncharacterized protein